MAWVSASGWLRVGVVGFFAIMAGQPSPAAAADGALGAAPVSWLDGPHATGDWGGGRSRLEASGVTLTASYTTGFFANAKGGFDTGVRYEGMADWGFDLDLESLVSWPDAGFRMSWFSYHGGQPSTDLVGLFPSQAVNSNESQGRIRFFEIALSQYLFDHRLRFEIGQFVSDREFFQSDSSAIFANGTFGFLGVSRSVMPFYPLAAPGVLLAARTADGHAEVRFAAYTGDIGEDEAGNIGFDWGFGEGASLFGELIVRPRVFGRRGSASFGVVGTTAVRTGFDSTVSADSGYAFYGVVDWPLLVNTGGDTHVSMFLRSFGTPAVDRAITHWYVSFGFMLRGVVPGRTHDALGFAFAWQEFTDGYRQFQADAGSDVSPHESIIEMTYRAKVLGWLSLQPDLQLVLDPHFSRRNAVVVGLRAMIVL